MGSTLRWNHRWIHHYRNRCLRHSSGSTNNDKNAPKVLIQAEPTTNALIIQAPEQVYRNLRMVITLLDVRRVQIMIEALIAAVTTSEHGTCGIQWIGGAGNNFIGIDYSHSLNDAAPHRMTNQIPY